MKTSQLLFLGILGISSFFVNAQNVQSTNLGTSGGSGAGISTSTSSANTFYGYNSGKLITAPGNSNSFFGQASGSGTTTGSSNCFFGSGTGYAGGVPTTLGSNNCIFGASAGPYVDGSENVSIGYKSLNYNTTASLTKTTAVGSQAGIYGYGSENVLIGWQAGAYKTGSNNVFIGNGVGESSSNKLNIDNSATATPLIWGDFASDLVKLNGKVGIGFGTLTTFPTTAGSVNVTGYKLFVTGGILTEEIRVNLRNGSSLWADYVFNKGYNLKSLNEVEKFIADNGHLPNVPSAKEVKENGIELGEMAKIQQEKIEELTLYLIQQNKELTELKAQVKALSKKS